MAECPVCGDGINNTVSAQTFGQTVDSESYDKVCILQKDKRGPSRSMKPTKDYSTTVYFHK